MPPHREDPQGIERLKSAMYSRKYAEGIHARPRHEFDTQEPQIATDWQHPKPPELPSLPAFIRPERSRTMPILKWTLGIAVLFFVGAVAFFIYYMYFGGFGAISGRNIDIVVTGPALIAGGEPVDLQVAVTNRNRDGLETADLIATFPDGTRIPPACASNSCRVSLGAIPAGDTRIVKLSAIYQGQAGAKASVKIGLEYRLADSNATFTTSSEYGFTFSTAPLSLSVDSNDEVVSGQQMQVKLNVTSNASQPIPGVVVAATYPFGFTPSTSDPPISGQDTSDLNWNLGTLVPGERKGVTLTGTLTGQAGESKMFHFTAGTNDGSATSSTVLADAPLSITVTQPFLNLALSVDGASSSQAVAVTPGQQVSVTINYKNNLDVAIDNAVVVAKLSGLPIDGTSIRPDNGFYRSTDSAVLWDKTTTQGDLDSLAPGKSGSLTFNFVVPDSTALAGIQNPALTISVSGSGQREGQTGVPVNEQSTISQKVAVASDLQIKSQGLYFTNPFGVSGNMPPKVEQETSYAIVLSITNTTNAIDGAKVTATLPPYVRLIGNHYLPSSEKVNFNGTTGIFTWTVGHIDPGAGLNGASPRQVIIELGFTPSTSQVGQAPVLLQDITLTGTDTLTGETVTRKATSVTSNIAGDPGFSSANANVVR